ncbi:MAG: rod shape-determining protein MreC [Candidatus Kerfeldbacteria bacterium]|nr:rod shape-determining protein MreC [Candidatus Kerfeldbacteria bacterium]
MTSVWKNRRATAPWVIPALISVVLILHYSHITRPLDNIITWIIQPLETRTYLLSQRFFGNQDRTEQNLSYNQLLAQHTEDQDTIQNLIIENAHLQTLVDEVHLLEEQNTFLQERSFQVVTARVTSRSTDQLSQTMVINRGSKQGIQTGLPVIVQNGLLVGMIREVQDYSAEVLLLTSFDARVSGLVQNDSQSPGIVTGAHNLTLEMDFIPQFDSVTSGQSVFTSGTDPFIPGGLVIGQIAEVKSDAGSLFQHASLESLFQPAEISIVSIILP